MSSSRRLLAEVIAEAERAPGGRFDDAAEMFRSVTLGEEFPTFLTIAAYARYLVESRRAELAVA